MKTSPHYNFITSNYPEARINKKYLSDDALNDLYSLLEDKEILFLERYQAFINYIKQNYPEISFFL